MKNCRPAAWLAPALVLLAAASAGAQEKATPTPAASPVASPSAAPSPSASASPKAAIAASPKPSPTAAGKGAASPAASPAASATPVAALSSSATPAPAPTPIVVVIPATPPAEPANNWIPGVVGMGLIAGGLYAAFRYARQRNLTVVDSLKKLGVELPADAAAASTGHLKPPSPVQPPLPSLSDLPPAGAAPPVASFAAASAAPGGAQIVGLAGALAGETFPLDAAAPLTIGRDAGNTLALTQDTGISRRHARLEKRGAGWVVVDEGSSNGTFVNGVRVGADGMTLQRGDEIQLGSIRLRFEG